MPLRDVHYRVKGKVVEAKRLHKSKAKGFRS